ncbi:MAG: DUF5682 family protein [Alphaproteobacteria bacterium]|nr:DUF5682 family protein [Alphaproteobacteria bacterium]
MTRLPRLTVVGVRHHSPACARLVGHTIRAQKPAFVLIEGPADFNPFITDLRLPHQLPVAIFSFHTTPVASHASYSPFCAWSPEWQALQTAWAEGAEPLFCDLPSWHPDFGDRSNRYADPHSAHAAAAETALGKALGEDGHDALWDALAEQATASEIGPRLDHYFNLLRPEGADDEREACREQFMARYAAWALREAGERNVVLVCGGWHAEAIRRMAACADGTRPQLAPLGEGETAGSYVVPFDYPRLDRFTGYASGMPSPAYYEKVSDHGLSVAADLTVNEISAALRQAGQVVSTADRIAWQAHGQALALTRGHHAVLRSDLLDAALATLIKDGLNAPAPWTQSGCVTAGTHPGLIAMLKAMTGTRSGSLTTGTRQPPLVADIERRLAAEAIEFRRAAQTITVDWNEPQTRSRAHLLNALRILGHPGVERAEGPLLAATQAPVETFRIVTHRDAQGAVIEASRWGGTLPMAAASRLADHCNQKPGDLAVLAATLSDALFAGLLGLNEELTRQIEGGVTRSHDIGAIGQAGLHSVRLYRFGTVFGDDAHRSLGQICEAVFDRVLWLIETIENNQEGLKAINAVLACRDLLRDCPLLNLQRDAMLAALERILGNPDAAPALAGAALGCHLACGSAEVSGTAARIRRFATADQLGDFLAGLFALAREEIATDTAVISAVKTLVADWSDDEFLRALPAMRQAFAWFPPRERERLAQAILRAHGVSEAAAEIEALAWMQQRSRVTDQAAAMALEARVAARLAAAGL